MAEAQASQGEGSGQGVVPWEASLHLGQEAVELIRQEGIPLFPLARNWEANRRDGSRWSSRSSMASWTMVRNTRYQPFHGSQAVAAVELRVEPLLDLHRAQLTSIDATEMLERMVLEGAPVSRVRTRIDHRLSEVQPVAAEFLDALSRTLAHLLLKLAAERFSEGAGILQRAVIEDAVRLAEPTGRRIDEANTDPPRRAGRVDTGRVRS
jgi:hypothetical protein